MFLIIKIKAYQVQMTSSSNKPLQRSCHQIYSEPKNPTFEKDKKNSFFLVKERNINKKILFQLSKEWKSSFPKSVQCAAISNESPHILSHEQDKVKQPLLVNATSKC